MRALQSGGRLWISWIAWIAWITPHALDVIGIRAGAAVNSQLRTRCSIVIFVEDTSITSPVHRGPEGSAGPPDLGLLKFAGFVIAGSETLVPPSRPVTFSVSPFR